MRFSCQSLTLFLFFSLTLSLSFNSFFTVSSVTLCVFNCSFFPACTRTTCQFGAKCVLQEDGSESCQCPLSCPLSYDPVCGNNKKTYANQCALNLETCLTNGSVVLAHEGKCCKKTWSSVISLFSNLLIPLFILVVYKHLINQCARYHSGHYPVQYLDRQWSNLIG